MIKFEERFVHCFWNDELEGKKGFFADTIGCLKDSVENNDEDWFGEIWKNPNNSQISHPFGFEESNGIKNCYQFCYYDPLYEMKVAYEEGKTIQYLSKLTDKWLDCEHRPLWNDDSSGYRIKPTEEYKVVIMFDAQGLAIVESDRDFRKVFFTGTKEECEKWLENNKDIQIVVNGYFSDEPIVYKEKGVKNDPWKETKDVPYEWNFDHYEYRVATHEEFLKKVHSPKKYVPFENAQELVEAWEKKYPTNKDRPNGTMPLIWIKEKKNENAISLITDFTGYGVSTSYKVMNFNDLFEKYTFADGSVCGKKEE